MDTITPAQNGQTGKGGKTTLYIVVFFLCVISVIVGYFRYQLSSSEKTFKTELSSRESESTKKLADLQAKTESQIKDAKTSLEADKIKQQATLNAEKIKQESAFKDREAKMKAAEAKVNDDLKKAAETVKSANSLKAAADTAKADADKKKIEADNAMKKAVASGNEVDKKLADEKKKLADEANMKVNAAVKKAEDEKQKAMLEAKKALELKAKLDSVSTVLMNVGNYNAIPGYPKSEYNFAEDGPVTSDPDQCRRWARAKGYAMWGHRNSSHPDPNYKNKCFAYTSAVQKGIKYTGDGGDRVNVVGCVDKASRPDLETCQTMHTIAERQTNADYWGDGNAIYLDRHDVTCNGDGLVAFQLTRPSANALQYRYACKGGLDMPNQENKNTGANDWGGGNTVYLDRHNVDCGKKPITQFRLIRPQADQLRYDYTCGNRLTEGACRDANTGWNDESNSSIYLDRHRVECNNNEVLTQFKLNRNGAGKFRYDYKCCKF